MQERLSFYIKRNSPLHQLNPLTKITAAFTLIILAFLGPGYWLPTTLFLLVIIPLVFLGKFEGEFLHTTVRLLLPVLSFLIVMQSLFYPGGKTILFNMWFLSVTAEGFRFGYLLATRILVMVSSFLLLLLSTHPSVLMSDLTNRGLPPTFAYVITSTLQIIPQMRIKAFTIIAAQRSRGLETEGNLRNRIAALIPLVRPLLFGSLVDVEERTIAIEARGFTSNKKKTSLTEIPETRVEKVARWIFLLLLIIIVGIGAFFGNH